MSLPAALTWVQLLPSGTRFSCANAPAWFESILREHAAESSSKSSAAVMWGRSWTHVGAEIGRRDAVVTINCPHVTTSRLIAAGYTYARRYAALPSLANARWFICLDTGKLAAASFSLYTPSRKSARIKKAIAQRLAKLRVPGWYRDEVIVASRQPPPLEVKIAELFPGQTIRLALSSGAPEPAINRKPSASVIDREGNVLAFAKIATSRVSREIVEHEAEILAGLAVLDRPQLVTPRLLFAGEVDGRYIAVQSPLPGTPAPAKFTLDHAKFLVSLQGKMRKPAAETNMVQSLAPRIAALQPARPALADALDAIMPTLEQTPVPSTIVHGDFAPWNLRTHDGKLAAFDWEYAEIDGLPLIDSMHFRLQVGLEMEKWDVATASERLASSTHDDFDTNQNRAILAVYLIDQLARLYREGYSSDHGMVAISEQLLARVEMPKPHWERTAALV